MSTDVMTPSRTGERGSHSGTGRRAAASQQTAPASETRRSPRPAHRPRTGRSAGPVVPAGPVSPEPVGSRQHWLSHSGQAGRTAFVVLLLGLLGGGLMCLLVVNTTLAANSIQISQLQQDNAATTQRIQQIQQQVAAQGSAAVISKEARRLGMRPVQVPAFIDLRTHASQSVILPGGHIPRRRAR